MISRVVVAVSIPAAAISCFTLGAMHNRQDDISLEAIRNEVRLELAKAPLATGTAGRVATDSDRDAVDVTSRARMVADIKRELQLEMGLLPVQLLRDRRSSFVELYSYDTLGKTNYGTAGYLGNGYFITVKHAVVALKDDDDRSSSRKITA